MTTLELTRPEAQTATRKAKALLDATEDLFGRYGDCGLTLRRIVHTAGCTTQNVYTHHGSRGGLVWACHNRAVRDATTMNHDTEQPLADGDVAVVAKTYVALMAARPGLHRMFTGDTPGEADPDLMVEQRRQFSHRIASVTNPLTAEALISAWDGIARNGGSPFLTQHVTTAILNHADGTGR